MSDVDETLQELVQRRARDLGLPGKPLTPNALAKNTNDLVSHETMRKIAQGAHTTIGDRVADGLAIALDVPVSTVLAAAGQRPRLGRFELPRRADRLTPPERQLIISMIDALLEAGERRLQDVGGSGRRTGKRAISGWRKTPSAGEAEA